METVYNNKKLNLNDKIISRICRVQLVTIQKWRKIHNIPAKSWTDGRWVDKRGYTKFLMARGYLHPELVPNKGRNVRFEHVIVMEKYLSENPRLEWSKKYLIDGKYLNSKCIVHHINFDPLDNRLENLWICESKSDHKKLESSLTSLVEDLIRSNLISFRNGNYFLNL